MRRSPQATTLQPTAPEPAADARVSEDLLPADDPDLLGLDLDALTERWAGAAARSAFNAEAMTGADRRAQALGVPGIRLMEHAGTAVAAAARALAVQAGTWGRGPVLILAGPGNNGGDGFVAARRLAALGAEVVVVLCTGTPRPSTADAGRNWDRLASSPGVTRMHAPAARDIELLGRGVGKACVVVDSLLGTGVRGALRDPIRSAVMLANRARSEGVPILAVDTPTAVDLTSGEASDPVVRADVTVTFHRPKVGLQRRTGRALAGRVLVAPIGIPPEADRG